MDIFQLFKMTFKCFMKFLSYNIEGVSSKLRNKNLLSEIMKYDFISLVETWLPDGSNLSIPGLFFHSRKGEQRTKKLNDTLGYNCPCKKRN